MKQLLKLLVAATVLTLVGCTVPKRVTVLEMPDTTTTTLPPVDITPYLNYADVYDGVYLDVDNVIEHAAIQTTPDGISKDFWFYSRVFKKRYIVLNPEAQSFTTFEIGFKPDKLYLRSTSPRGEVHRYGLTDLKQVLSSKDDYDYKFAFPHVEKGTVIDIGYEWTYSVARLMPPLEEDIPLQYTVPCEHLRFRFSCPESWQIHIKADTPGVHAPVERTTDPNNHMLFLTYEASHVPAFKMERFSPPVGQSSPHLTFRIGDIFVAGQFIKSIDSWDKVVEQLFKYELGKAEIFQDPTQQRKQSNELPEALRKLADSLGRIATTRFDTVEAVNRYVSTAIKLAGKPHAGNAAATLLAKKGGRFDIASLEMTLLELLQIPSNLVLLHDRDDGGFDRAFVSMSQFSTLGVRVRLDTTDCLLFPWVKNLPITFIPPSFRGEPAVVLGDRSINSMWTVPVEQSGVNRIEQAVSASIDSEMVIHSKTALLFEGANAFSMRRAIEELKSADATDSLRHWLLPVSANIQFDSLQLVNDTDYYRPLNVNLFYKIPNAISVTPEEIIVRIGDLMSPIWGYRVAEDSSTRTQDVDVDFPHSYRRLLTLATPHGWTLTSNTTDQRDENQFGSSQYTVRFGNDSLTVDQATTMLRTRQPKEQIGRLQELLFGKPGVESGTLIFATPRP